jgi:hypothetical protein
MSNAEWLSAATRWLAADEDVRVPWSAAEFTFRGLLSYLIFRQFFNQNIAEAYRSVIALEEDETGLIDFSIDFAAGGFGAFDIVVNRFSVQDDGDFISDDGRLGRLPLSTGFGDELRGRPEVVNGAIPAGRRFAGFIVAKDLNFMAAAQVEATVRVIRDHVFVLYREIPKLCFGYKIRPVLAWVDGVFEDAAFFDRPAIVTRWIAQFPTGDVISVKKRPKAAVVRRIYDRSERQYGRN